MGRIRTEADPEAVLRQVRDGDLLLQLSLTPEFRFKFDLPYAADLSPLFNFPGNPYLSSRIYRFTFDPELSLQQPASNPGDVDADQMDVDLSNSDVEKVYQVPFHGTDIIDGRLEDVDITKWTAVSFDNGFMRKLLGSFLLNEYACFPMFHKDIFLNDMMTGRKRYCSSMLVNAVLAAGCVGPPFFYVPAPIRGLNVCPLARPVEHKTPLRVLEHAKPRLLVSNRS